MRSDRSAHGLTMNFTWTVLGFFQLLSRRYLKGVAWVHHIHKYVGLLILAICVVAASMKADSIKYHHSFISHMITGLTIILLLVVLVVVGFLAELQLKHNKWDYNPAKRLKNVHTYLGWALILASQYQVIYGLMLHYYEDVDAEQYYSYMINEAYLLFVFMIEMFYQIYKRLDPKKSLPKRELSVEEFDGRVKSGENLVFLEDLVLDIGKFMERHPGGAFALKHSVGHDVSKYFFGAYSLEIMEGQHTHKHSRIAFEIVKSLSIARLSLPISVYYASLKEATPITELAATFVFFVEEQAKENAYTFQTFYPGVDNIGKYFVLSSEQLHRKLKRQYSICNMMRGHVYKDYLCVISSILQGGGGPQQLQASSLDTSPDRTFSLTVKSYPSFRGMSWFLHTRPASARFKVRGPMGKGLCLQPNKTHIAFGAGTGVLPFVDLVAYILRLNAGLLHEEEQKLDLGPDFRFVLYASYPDRHDAVALEFIEGVRDVTRKLGKENFRLVLRLSCESKERWDYQFVNRARIEEENMARMYACGPPVMSEVIDKIFERMSEEEGLPRDIFEIL